MVKTAIQFYTLRHLEESVPELLERVAETPLDGGEFGVSDDQIADVAATLDETGLEAANLGAGPETLSDPDRVAAQCDALDCDGVMLGYLGSEHFESVEAITRTAARLSRWATALEERGITLQYHNHDHEFVEVGGEPAYHRLVEQVDDAVKFELDLGWVGTGGGDPYGLLAELGDRVPSVHVKDMHFESGEFAELGEGDLDLDRAFGVIRDVDPEWVIYEHDEPADPAASLEHGAAILEEYTR